MSGVGQTDDSDAGLIRRLVAERDEALERVHQLEAMLGDDDWVPAEGELTPTQRVMVMVLERRRIASKEALMLALYGERHEMPGVRVLDTLMWGLRKRLEAHGIEIRTIWGTGWVPTLESRARLTALREARNG